MADEINEEIGLIIKSKIKSAVPELSVAGEVPDALNKKGLKMLKSLFGRLFLMQSV